MTTTTLNHADHLVPTAGWRRALTSLIATQPDGAAALARVALALVMLPHAAQHTGGWLGGFGYTKMMGYFASLGIPSPFGFAAIAAEVLAPLALLVGLGGRLAALSIAAVMAVAVATVHAPNGFFMNWLGNQPGEGYEYHLLAIALAGVVFLRGSGRWSLDRHFTERAATP
ncbi:MAG TPA: DoxX family protein [Polyangia bacterium]|nr:DoxX family protein [Polyangia bacterium]